MMNVVPILNIRFGCPSCGATGSWARAARSTSRQNSSIHHLACARCGERIVVKVSEGGEQSDGERVQLHEEYETLRTLRREFPQDERFGTLVPLGYLEAGGRGVMITRWFRGKDLVHFARTLRATETEAVFQCAGIWLRKLHDAGRTDPVTRSLGVMEKTEDLLRSYGAVLRGDPKTRRACDLWAREGLDLEALGVRSVRLHGDFKPQNILCGETRYVGLDIHWNNIGGAAYDVAPFLNHLWLAGLGMAGSRAAGQCKLAERGLLAGYGKLGDARALRWVQLYFALCYLGGYRQRGVLSAGYARWRVWPLVRDLAGQLRGLV